MFKHQFYFLFYNLNSVKTNSDIYCSKTGKHLFAETEADGVTLKKDAFHHRKAKASANSSNRKNGFSKRDAAYYDRVHTRFLKRAYRKTRSSTKLHSDPLIGKALGKPSDVCVNDVYGSNPELWKKNTQRQRQFVRSAAQEKTHPGADLHPEPWNKHSCTRTRSKLSGSFNFSKDCTIFNTSRDP